MRPKIAYFTINDPLDKRSWSGITYYMGQSLLKNVGDVVFLGPVKIPYLLDKSLRLLQKLSRLLTGTAYIPKYSLLKNGFAAWKLNRKLKMEKFDFIVGPAAASELGCLKTRIPIVYFGDATYKIYSEMYTKEFKNLNSISRREGNYLEQKALTKSDLVIFSSQWAANSAINDYHVPTTKIAVMNLGANIDSVLPKDLIYKKESNKTLTLLFLSVDWERKGGSIAFDTLKLLKATGLDVELIVCGCIPPAEFAHPSMKVIPFLDKNKREDFDQFVIMFSKVHFLLLPTRADCTPLVNCEANAYGVPAITTDVGGVSYAVKNDVNGYCLPFKATGKDYADLIDKIYADKKRFHDLITSSRKMFEEQLNWDTFSDNFKQALEKHAIYNFTVAKDQRSKSATAVAAV